MLGIKTILISAFTLIIQQTSEVKHFNHTQSVFINGYDVLSYFSQKPVKGLKENEFVYKGLHFYFVTKQNKQMFENNPNKYIPQYGGWCAYAMAENGSKVSVDPKTFKMVNGKLFLFYNSFGTNTLKKWNEWKNEESYIKKADAFWKAILVK